MGFTNVFLASIIISDIINKKHNKYIKLFNPKRKNLSKTINIIPNALNSIEGYIKGYFIKNKSVKYDKENNKKIMIYKDNKVYKNCPHLGCKLLFNEQELTWDCPCHGSRFDLDGTCISGPSNKNIYDNQ